MVIVDEVKKFVNKQGKHLEKDIHNLMNSLYGIKQ